MASYYMTLTASPSAGAALSLTPNAGARRVTFKPLQTGSGIYAAISVPAASRICSASVKPVGVSATGTLLVSPVNPEFSYDGCFLCALLEIEPAAVGPSLWRKTEIHEGGYTTLLCNPGTLYLVIPNGPAAETEADVMFTFATE
jgi:hypothetical protein